MSLGSLDRYNAKPGGSGETPAPVTATAYAPGTSGRNAEDVSIQELLQVLRKRWPMVLIVTAAMFVIAGAITLLQTPIFRSQTVLLVEQRRGDPRTDGGLLGDMMGMTQARSLETQVEILRSQSLQNDALADVDPTLLERRGKERPRITVDSVRDTDLIKIRVESPNAPQAAHVANALVKRYIDQNTSLNRQTVSKARQFVEVQIGELKQSLSVAEGRLRDFRQRSGVVALDEETRERVARLAETQSARSAAQTEREALKAQASVLARQRDEIPARLVASNSFVENPVVTQLQSEIAKLEVERAGLLKEFVPGAPEVAAVQARIDTARARIETEVGKVLAQEQETLNPIHQDTLRLYASLQAQVFAQSARVSGLSAAIDQEQKALRELPQKQLELAQLLRNATELEKTYTLLNARFQELKIQEESVVPNARVIDLARPGRAPVRPSRTLNLILGTLVGAMFGLGLVFLQEQMDTTVKSPEELERHLGIPTLGVVAMVKDPTQRLLSEADSRSGVAETFRMIRSSIQFASVSAPVRSLMVTSPSPGEGKSTTAANLAMVMAQKGLRVILIDCDLRRPTVHTTFKISNTVGLTTAVVGMAQPEEVLFRSTVENLCVVPAGPLPPNPAELLESAKAREVFDRFRAVADLVIFDTPPCTVLADAAVVATQTDGAVLVLHGSKTDRKAAQRAVHLLREAGTRIFGAVLNKVNLEREGYYYQNYYQYYYYYGGYESGGAEGGKKGKKKRTTPRLGSGSDRKDN
jgi:capsular exopolysaccharide synthesis family protein